MINVRVWQESIRYMCTSLELSFMHVRIVFKKKILHAKFKLVSSLLFRVMGNPYFIFQASYLLGNNAKLNHV